MSYEYPTSDDLLIVEEDLQEYLDSPTVKQLIAHQKRIAANNPNFGQPFNPADLPDYTYTEPFDISKIAQMGVCETYENDLHAGVMRHIVVDANDVTPLFEAMGRSDYSKTQGLLRRFQDDGITNTTQVAQYFADAAMNKKYDNERLKPHILSNPTKVGNVNVVNVNFNKQESRTYVFSAANKDFHETFKNNVLLLLRHRITQEAIEKNRDFFPSGAKRDPEHMRDSFTWDKFAKMADLCTEEAFRLTKRQMEMQRTHAAVQQITKTYSEQFKSKLQPKIKDENLIQSFGKEFKARKNETKTQAVSRIRSEFKEHSNKKFDEFKARGLDMILAQGIAQARGSKSVKPEHMKEAGEMFNRMKKNPVEYRSLSKIFREVTGNDKEAHKALMHNMDGRSSFQRSRKNLEVMGAHLYANSQGRTRVRKDDAIHAKAFAASATLGTPAKPLKKAINEALTESGYQVGDVIKARQQMAKAAGRIKDERGKDTSRDELLKRAEPVQQVKDKPVEPKRGPDDDDGGYTPDGSGGRRRRR